MGEAVERSEDRRVVDTEEVGRRVKRHRRNAEGNVIVCTPEQYL